MEWWISQRDSCSYSKLQVHKHSWSSFNFHCLTCFFFHITMYHFKFKKKNNSWIYLYIINLSFIIIVFIIYNANMLTRASNWCSIKSEISSFFPRDIFQSESTTLNYFIKTEITTLFHIWFFKLDHSLKVYLNDISMFFLRASQCKTSFFL